MERFLAVHIHLRYQELVTHKRVVLEVISIWVLIALLSSVTFEGAAYCSSQFHSDIRVEHQDVFNRSTHKNQMQSIQIRGEAQSEEM